MLYTYIINFKSIFIYYINIMMFNLIFLINMIYVKLYKILLFPQKFFVSLDLNEFLNKETVSEQSLIIGTIPYFLII